MWPECLCRSAALNAPVSKAGLRMSMKQWQNENGQQHAELTSKMFIPVPPFSPYSLQNICWEGKSFTLINMQMTLCYWLRKKKMLQDMIDKLIEIGR
jgi:hypothetical protein